MCNFFIVLEGYCLYKALVVVFEKEERLFPIYLVGYGVPGAIVVTTLIVVVILERENDPTEYHSDTICWLSDKYIYFSFFIPVVLVLCFNFIILIRGVIVTYRVIFLAPRKLCGNLAAITLSFSRLPSKSCGTTTEKSKLGLEAAYY